MNLNIIKNFLTKNRCYQNGATCTKIGIQIHTIGTGQNTAANVAQYWNQSAVSTCVHYCVDAEIPGKVLQFLPETIRSWADAGYGNDHLITIEICESDYISYQGGASYSVGNAAKFKADIMRGYQTAVELCAKICKERGWNPKKKLSSGLYLISSHDEGRRKGLSSAHVDPSHVWDRFGLSMDGFRNDVVKAMKPELKLKKGEKVRLTKDIYIRNHVSTESVQGRYVRYTDLSASAQKKSKRVDGNKAKLKKGTKVEILEVKTAWNGDKWIRIKSGWLPVIVKKDVRVTST